MAMDANQQKFRRSAARLSIPDPHFDGGTVMVLDQAAAVNYGRTGFMTPLVRSRTRSIISSAY